MEYSELFSRKFGLRPTSQGLIYDQVPETTRIGLFYIIFGLLRSPYLPYSYYQHLYQEICRILKIKWDWTMNHEIQYANAIENTILKCEWHTFYEICQIAYSYFKEEESPHSSVIKPGTAKVLQEQVNALFKDEFLGFEIQNGKIERMGNPIIDAKIREARILLKDPEFKSADELFEKAIKALNVRPKPDSENCIKDAVATVESVGKIIRKDKKARIDNIIKDAIQKGVIPQLLGDPIIKLYAYRGNEPAVAHGGIEPSKVTIDEAEFVLAMSAAIIIYLVKKSGLI